MVLSTELSDNATVAVSELSTIGVVIPTYNAARHWNALRNGIEKQGIAAEQVLIIDSSSTDGTPRLAAEAGYKVVRIRQSDFNHGGTRQLASEHMDWAEVLIYLTQDAVPSDENSFRHLYDVFADPEIGAAYGRQIARANAGPIERHARVFNYPQISSVRSFASREQLGIKAAFLSNSFAAYRRVALQEVGGFPTDVIIAEDSTVAARLLIAGWKIAYAADAAVIHSHPWTIGEEFSRYFDTGVHHAREHWILEKFGSANEEGKRFLVSELSYLLSTGAHLIPVAVLRTISKFVAYQLGRRYSSMPWRLKTYLSSQPAFWNRATTLSVHTTK